MIIRPYQVKDFNETKKLCEKFVAMIEDLLSEEFYRFEAMADDRIDYILFSLQHSKALEWFSTDLKLSTESGLSATIRPRSVSCAATAYIDDKSHRF